MMARGPHRRELLGGLVVGIALPAMVTPAIAAPDPPPRPPAPGGRPEPAPPVDGPGADAFIRIDRAGMVTLVIPSVEMGQGIYTSEAMLLAEELEAPLERIRLEHAPPNDALYGNALSAGQQVTGGSTSIRGFWKPLRVAGAQARHQLIGAAAARWGVPPESCRAEAGEVVHGATGRRLGYGALADAASSIAPPADPPLKPVSEFKLIGRSSRRLDTPAKVTGETVYGIDVRLPGLRYAAVAGCPTLGGRLAGFDRDAASAVPGVSQVVETENALAVVASNTWAARRGLDAASPRWAPGPNAGLHQRHIREALAKASREGRRIEARKVGDAAAAIAAADDVHQAEYQLPFLAHAAMEPINATVHVTPGRCEIWAGTQVPTRARGFVARALGLPPEQVVVNNQYIGGGFGRRLEVDFIVQAALLARQVEGPVQVCWSREEDIRHDMYRPAYHDVVAAALDGDGYPTAWSHVVTGGSVLASFLPEALPPSGLDGDAVEGAAEPVYGFEPILVQYVRQDPPPGVPISWWRGVGPAHNVFVVETFIDELAHKAGVDPVEYRRRLLAKSPRARGVLDLAARESGWGGPLPSGYGRGVSVQSAFGSYLACVVEAGVAPGGDVKLRRATVAIDNGVTVNPDTVAAQIEGGLLFGLSAALWGEITLERGRVQQSNFHDYRVLRIDEAPHVAVRQVRSEEAPGGLGETGTVAAFPALGNAIFAATGVRLRSLPFDRRALSRKGRAEAGDGPLVGAALGLAAAGALVWKAAT